MTDFEKEVLAFFAFLKSKFSPVLVLMGAAFALLSFYIALLLLTVILFGLGVI